MKQSDLLQVWKDGGPVFDSSGRKTRRIADGIVGRGSSTTSIYFQYPAGSEAAGLPGGDETFRIRYYNDNPDFFRLEKKWAAGGNNTQQSSTISTDECLGLLLGDIDFLKSSDNLLYLELYAKMHYRELRPTLLMEQRHDVPLLPTVQYVEADSREGHNVIKAFLERAASLRTTARTARRLSEAESGIAQTH